MTSQRKARLYVLAKAAMQGLRGHFRMEKTVAHLAVSYAKALLEELERETHVSTSESL